MREGSRRASRLKAPARPRQPVALFATWNEFFVVRHRSDVEQWFSNEVQHLPVRVPASRQNGLVRCEKINRCKMVYAQTARAAVADARSLARRLARARGERLCRAQMQKARGTACQPRKAGREVEGGSEWRVGGVVFSEG